MGQATQQPLLEIDGSFGEGGGQLVRTALSLSAITGRPFRLERIRAGRPEPGLRAQHLTAVRAAAQICGARVEGDQLGSRALTFVPVTLPQAGAYHWEVGTAGSVSLILQTVLLPLALMPGRSDITLIGGTHVAWSPPVDYVQQVYVPGLSGECALAEGQGSQETDSAGPLAAHIDVESWGWYPRGGGRIRASIQGSFQPRGLHLMERGSLRSVTVLSAASNLPDHIPYRQAERADALLRKQGIKSRVKILMPSSPGQGTVVFLIAQYKRARAAFTAYGRLRKPAERVAEEACRAFARYHKRGQPVDEHLADQLLLAGALASEPSEYAVESVTQHLVTNAWVIREFVDDVRIEIDGEQRHPGVVRISKGR